MTFQAVASSTNSTSLVIGEITAAEVEASAADCPFIDGAGIYLVAMNNQSLAPIGEVLAKFVSQDAAQELARFFRAAGKLEMA